MKTRRRFHPRELPPFSAGMYTGMTDSIDPAAARNDRARMLLNCYVPPGPPGTPVVGRPGFIFRGITGGDPLGTGSEVGQGLFFWKELDGTRHLNAVVDGTIYEYNFSTSVFAAVVTQADCTTASVTFSTTARVKARAYLGEVIISDGTNEPFSWDGSSGDSGLTPLTEAEIFYGRPAVHYAKVMAIKAAERNAFVWSEEAAANTGYESSGYNNAWNPLGTDAFNAIEATNEALYLFRARGITEILGRVNDEFQTAGTRSSVSESEGTLGDVLVTDRGVFFVNADAQPHYFLPGGKPLPLWDDCRQTIKDVPKSALGNAIILEYTPISAVLVGLPENGQTTVGMWLVYRIDQGDPNLVGVFNGFDCLDACIAENASGEPVWFHLGATDGYVYEHGNPDGVLWNDEYPDTTIAIQHEIQGHPLGLDMAQEKVWDRVDIVLALPAGITADYTYATPRGAGSVISIDFDGTGGVLYDTMNYDTFNYADDSAIEAKQTAGLSAHGRWLQPILRHAALGEQFAFTSWQHVALATTTDRTVK